MLTSSLLTKKEKKQFIEKLQEIFSQNSSKTYLLIWANQATNVGHAVIADLRQNVIAELPQKRFFDPNFGFHKYPTPDKCLEGVIKTAKKYNHLFYPKKHAEKTNKMISWTFIEVAYRERPKFPSRL
jgi:hypothetical protein